MKDDIYSQSDSNIGYVKCINERNRIASFKYQEIRDNNF
jgi:hypothetical protein